MSVFVWSCFKHSDPCSQEKPNFACICDLSWMRKIICGSFSSIILHVLSHTAEPEPRIISHYSFWGRGNSLLPFSVLMCFWLSPRGKKVSYPFHSQKSLAYVLISETMEFCLLLGLSLLPDSMLGFASCESSEKRMELHNCPLAADNHLIHTWITERALSCVLL